MNKQDRDTRNRRILNYIKLNPCNYKRSELVEHTARRYKLSVVQIYRIMNGRTFDCSNNENEKY